MSEEQGKPFEVVADEALEARIVSWVLGEAFEFEAEELQRLCNERPELEVFRRRMVAVHGLAGEGLKKPETDWKLPAAKRQKVLDAIGAGARESRRERASRFAARQVLLAAAACLALTVIVAVLAFPLFFRARAWKAGSENASVRMDERNRQLAPQMVTYSAGEGDEAGLMDLEDSVESLTTRLDEKPKYLNGEENGRALGFSYKGSGPVTGNRRGGIDEDFSGGSDITVRGSATAAAAGLSKGKKIGRDPRVPGRELAREESGEPAAPANRPAAPRKARESLAAIVPPTAAPEPAPPPKLAPEPKPAEAPAADRGIVNGSLDGSFGTAGGSGRVPGGGGNAEGKVPVLGDIPMSGRLFGRGEGQQGGEGDVRLKAGRDVGGIVAGGTRSGDMGISRNSVDAILDKQGRKHAEAAAGAPASRRTTELRATKGEATPAQAPADSGGDARAELLAQVDAAWEEALETPEEEEAPAAEKANKKVANELAARARGKRQAGGPGALHLMDKEGQPMGGEVDGYALEGVGSGAGGGGEIEELAERIEDNRKWKADEGAATSRTSWHYEHGKAGSGNRDETEALLRQQSELYFSDGTMTGPQGLTDRSKTLKDTLGPGLEERYDSGGRQESAVQRLREDMAGDDHFKGDAGDAPAVEFQSRTLDVGTDFLHRFKFADKNGEDDDGVDPFVDESESSQSLLGRKNAGDVLLGYGFALPEGSQVSFDAEDGKLFIMAPEDTVTGLQQLVDSLPKPPQADDAIDLMAEMSAQEEPFSTFSLHVSDASFRVAAAALERGERPDPEAVRPEEFYNAFDYGDPAPTAGEPVACAIEQCAHPLLPSRNLVRVGVRTAAAGRGAGQPLRLTVLLDNSGSMEREDRRAAVQAAMEQLATLLGPQDVVTVVGFARQPRLLCDRVSGDGVKAQLEGLVEKTPAEGGTNLEQALALADELAMRQFAAGAQNRIVLLTDGAANLGNADPEDLAKRIEGLRQKGVSFDAAGFGTAGMNDRMLERLTRDGNGRYYVVDGPEDADEQFAKKLAGAFRPAAENVKVQVRFNPSRVGGYRLIGFEEHRLKKEDFRDDTVDAAEMASEEAGVAVYQVELLPDGEGEIGEVSVRFRDASKGKMVERSWTMPHDESAPGFDRAPASMQVAGLAVLAADALRDGPLAPLTDWGELAPVSNQVRAEFGGSEKVGQLLRMVERLR